MEEEILLTTEETARILKITPSTLRIHRQNGTGIHKDVCPIKVGEHWRYPKQAVIDFATGRRNKECL